MRIPPNNTPKPSTISPTENRKPEIEKSVADFARYIYKERKLKLAEKIIEQFREIYNQKNGIVEAEVVSREKLDEAIVKKVKALCERKISRRKKWF